MIMDGGSMLWTMIADFHKFEVAGAFFPNTIWPIFIPTVREERNIYFSFYFLQGIGF